MGRCATSSQKQTNVFMNQPKHTPDCSRKRSLLINNSPPRGRMSGSDARSYARIFYCVIQMKNTTTRRLNKLVKAHHGIKRFDLMPNQSAHSPTRDKMNETKVVPVDAALDALNRMQSLIMMDDGQHPRNVLRSFISAVSPAPQERRVGRRRSYDGLGEPARVTADRRTAVPIAAGAADGQAREKSLIDNALASGETGSLPAAPALSLSQEWARSMEKQMKENDATPNAAPGERKLSASGEVSF